MYRRPGHHYHDYWRRASYERGKLRSWRCIRVWFRFQPKFRLRFWLRFKLGLRLRLRLKFRFWFRFGLRLRFGVPIRFWIWSGRCPWRTECRCLGCRTDEPPFIYFECGFSDSRCACRYTQRRPRCSGLPASRVEGYDWLGNQCDTRGNVIIVGDECKAGLWRVGPVITT